MKNKIIKDLSLAQFAKYCGVHPQTVISWIKNGEISANKINSKNDYSKCTIGIENLAKVKFVNRNIGYDQSVSSNTNQSSVLIVDDDESMIKLIAHIFSSNGFKVITASNAYDAMILIREERPQFLTLDLKMTDSSGKNVLKMINDLDIHQSVWVVIISAASEPELQGAVDFGADFYLKKPFHKNDLNKIITKLNVHGTKKAA